MKSQNTRYNESSSFSNNLMKRERFRATRGMGENDFRRELKVIIKCNVKASALCAGGGNLNSDQDTIQQIVFISNNLMER